MSTHADDTTSTDADDTTSTDADGTTSTDADDTTQVIDLSHDTMEEAFDIIRRIDTRRSTAGAPSVLHEWKLVRYTEGDGNEMALLTKGAPKFELPRRPKSAICFPLISDETGRLSTILLSNERRHPDDPSKRISCLENPGGHIEDGETPLEAAERELMEETGFHRGLEGVTKTTVLPWEDFAIDPERSLRARIPIHYEMSGTLTEDRLDPQKPSSDAKGEIITPHIVPLDQMKDFVRDRQQSGVTINPTLFHFTENRALFDYCRKDAALSGVLINRFEIPSTTEGTEE